MLIYILCIIAPCFDANLRFTFWKQVWIKGAAWKFAGWLDSLCLIYIFSIIEPRTCKVIQVFFFCSSVFEMICPTRKPRKPSCPWHICPFFPSFCYRCGFSLWVYLQQRRCSWIIWEILWKCETTAVKVLLKWVEGNIIASTTTKPRFGQEGEKNAWRRRRWGQIQPSIGAEAETDKQWGEMMRLFVWLFIFHIRKDLRSHIRGDLFARIHTMTWCLHLIAQNALSCCRSDRATALMWF